jgi:hypothetical protein
MHMKYKSKKLLKLGFEPRISCIPSSCLNHYASSKLVVMLQVIVYVYCCTWRLMMYVWRGTSPPPLACASHHDDIAGPSLNMDLFNLKADLEVRVEAGLGG